MITKLQAEAQSQGNVRELVNRPESQETASVTCVFKAGLAVPRMEALEVSLGCLVAGHSSTVESVAPLADFRSDVLLDGNRAEQIERLESVAGTDQERWLRPESQRPIVRLRTRRGGWRLARRPRTVLRRKA